MSKHILFKTDIEGTRFEIRLLPGQPILKEIPNLADLKITGPLAALTRLAMGTVFSSSNFTFPEEGHLHINDFTPMFFEKNILPMASGITPELTESINFMIDYMIDSEDFGVELAKFYAKQYEAYGHTFDWEALIAPKPVATEPIAESTNLRRTIAANYPVPKEEDTGFHIDPELWFLLVRNVLRKENTLLIGPTGSGKTEILFHLAKAMELPLSIQDMGTVQDAQSALLGVHRLNSEGHSEFDPAPFIGHIQTPGIVLLDEMNRAPLAANNILFPALDTRRYIPLDIAAKAEERKIPVHEGVVFFATANLGSEYSGTQAIDRALLDRFFPVELDYPAEKHEIKILVLRTGVDEKSATAIVRVSNEVRKQYKAQELSNAISVRHTLQAASLIKDGFETSNAIMNTIMPLFEDGIGVSERSKVKSIIAAF